jgi:hypothetical protein
VQRLIDKVARLDLRDLFERLPCHWLSRLLRPDVSHIPIRTHRARTAIEVAVARNPLIPMATGTMAWA